MKQYFLAVFFFLTTVFSLQAVELELQYSSKNLNKGEVLRLQLKVDGVDRSAKISFPRTSKASFQQMGSPSMSSQTVIINGSVQSFKGLVYSIEVIPKVAGNIETLGITIEYQNKKYTTKNIVFRVSSTNKKTGMYLFLKTSKNRVYEKEGVILEVQWLINENVNEYDFKLPILQDDTVFSETVPTKSLDSTLIRVEDWKLKFDKSSIEYKGKPFTAFTTKIKLYFKDPKRVSIPAASIKAKVEKGTVIKRNMFGYRQRVSNYKVISAVSNQVVLLVRAVPKKNKPILFTGAVGTSFQVSSSSKYKAARVGDPIDLSIIIKGNGYLDFIQRLKLSKDSSYQNFSVQDNITSGEVEEDRLTFLETIRAKNKQVTEIPAVVLHYFNPRKNKYETAKSLPINIQIKDSESLSEDDIVAYKGTPKEKSKTLEYLRKGLRANVVFDSSPSPQAPLSYLFILLVSLLTLFSALGIKYKVLISKVVQNILFKRINNNSSKQLKIADEKLKKGEGDFLKELYKALDLKIQETYSSPLNEALIQELKKEQKLNETTAQEIQDFMHEYNFTMYSNQKLEVSSQEKMFERVKALIEAI